ncbi:hypothetical protein H5410_057573 [Solanum commersonii]|uniref:Uncharacterized protein n=1 Tax=Solanum commersonii TaxID=4109 RepID=A0A9J5WQF6_SOLCO|nr:hypothetical protein H5410_057573 [Solanum commersonii]
MLVEEAHIRRRWQTYLHKLLNEERDRDIVLGELKHSESHRNFGCCRYIKVVEVKGSIHMSERATRLDEIPMKFWKTTDEAVMEWLTGLFDVIFRTAKMPEEWR